MEVQVNLCASTPFLILPFHQALHIYSLSDTVPSAPSLCLIHSPFERTLPDQLLLLTRCNSLPGQPGHACGNRAVAASCAIVRSLDASI